MRLEAVSLLAISLLLGSAAPAFSQMTGQPLSSTPDISVSASSTADVTFAVPLTSLYLKNDCSDALYFDLTGQHHGSTGSGTPQAYPLRLGQGEEYYGEVRFLVTLSVSSGSASACTFTAQGYQSR